MVDKKEIRNCITFLENDPKIECNPYPCYPAEVFQALSFAAAFEMAARTCLKTI